MSRIKMPPTHFDKDKRVDECTVFGEPFGIDFEREGDLTISDRDFFKYGGFPVGHFGKDSQLSGYEPERDDAEVHFKYEAAGGPFDVRLFVKKQCP